MADDSIEKNTDELFNDSVKSVDAAYLEQYKLYLELLDRISERRQSANSFFLSVNTAVCALIGYFCTKDASAELRSLLVFAPVAGILLSYFWYRLVKSYRDLNSVKFQIVHKIEQRLPLAPYRAEWIALGEGKNTKIFTPFTHLEIWVPLSFVALYVALILTLLPWQQIVNR